MQYEDMDKVIENTLRTLKTFKPLELFFRKYYRLVNNIDHYTPEEKKRILKEYENNKFLSKEQEPDVLSEDHFFGSADIAVNKHCRYLPGKYHTHNFIEIFYIFSGTCIHVCHQQKYNLCAGDFCFWEYDAPHKIISNSDNFLAINILIRRNCFEKMFFPLLKTQNILSSYFQNILYGNTSHPMILFRTGSDKKLRYFVSCLYQEETHKDTYYGEMMTNFLSEILIYLLRTHLSHVISKTTEHSTGVTAILQYIQEHYNTVTLNEVCSQFSYSPAYLSRLIKKSFGMTFSEIIKNQRLDRAKWLLENTEMSIPDIALEVGCTDTSHLYRLFKQDLCTTPLKYRHAYQRAEAL